MSESKIEIKNAASNNSYHAREPFHLQGTICLRLRANRFSQSQLVYFLLSWKLKFRKGIMERFIQGLVWCEITL